MPLTIQFESVPSGLFQTYTEQGFNFSTVVTQQNNLPDAFWNRTQTANLGTGGYLINQYSSDTVTAKAATGQVFGATSIAVNGFSFQGFTPAGQPITGTSVVTYYFNGVKTDGNIVTYQFTTDNIDGFQTVALPTGFASGLTEFNWFIQGGTGWGAFDNLVLQLNTAPVANAFTGSVLGGTLFTGHLVATDADNQPLTFQSVGALPAGVVLDANGAFYVQPLSGDGDLTAARTVSFQYRAFDGSDYSATKTATVTVNPIPAGPDKLGTYRADTLAGTAGADRIWGNDGNDVIQGGDGHDTMTGDDGNDSLDGGSGNDLILGCDGRDTIAGGAGNDTLTGGDDNDQFVISNGFGNDVIFDFNSGHWEKDGRHERNRGYDWDNNDCRYWDDNNGHWDRYDDHWKWDAGDVIKISPSVFGSYDDLMAHAKQTWYGVVITSTDGQNSLTLVGVNLRSLNSEDFLFS
jgi:Ca2+-binding RTX toxin-like protein